MSEAATRTITTVITSVASAVATAAASGAAAASGLADAAAASGAPAVPAMPPLPASPPGGPIQDRSKDLISVCIAVVTPVLIIVPLRLWVRWRMVGKVGADDWAILAAMLCSATMATFVLLSARYGAGRHMAEINPADIPTGLMYNLFSQVFAVPSIGLVKVSIGLFLLRLASTNFYRRICIGFIVLMSCYSCASTFTVIFQCTPVKLSWDNTVKGKCMPPTVRVNLGKSYSTISAITDILLVLLPIAMLWNVQIGTKQRWMICGILSLGAFACAASIVKLTLINTYGATGDFLWDSVDVSSWTSIEADVGIITACLPALKPLFVKVLGKTVFAKSVGTGDGSGHKMTPLGSGQRSGVGNRGIRNDISASHHKRSHIGGTFADNESEEGIIGISKNTEVRVDIETVSNRSIEEKRNRGDIHHHNSLRR